MRALAFCLGKSRGGLHEAAFVCGKRGQKARLGKRLTGRIIHVEDDDAEEGADRFRAQDS